jgi:hypothetical protein
LFFVPPQRRLAWYDDNEVSDGDSDELSDFYDFYYV